MDVTTPLDDAGPTDITPYFWKNSNFRYMLSKPSQNVAHVDLLPNVKGATTVLMAKNIGIEVPVRTIRIPTDQDLMVIVGGGSPRFAGEICIFEVITSEL